MQGSGPGKADGGALCGGVWQRAVGVPRPAQPQHAPRLLPRHAALQVFLTLLPFSSTPICLPCTLASTPSHIMLLIDTPSSQVPLSSHPLEGGMLLLAPVEAVRGSASRVLVERRQEESVVGLPVADDWRAVAQVGGEDSGGRPSQ